MEKGDKVLLNSGEYSIVTDIRKYNEKTNVFNFHVENTNCYFAE